MSENKKLENRLSTDDITIGYDRDLIDRISFEVKPGNIVTLIGPNGCGKSTLLKSVSGQLKVRDGVVYLFKEDRKSSKFIQTIYIKGEGIKIVKMSNGDLLI